MGDPQSTIERILNFTLEIIHLLDGEDYIAGKLLSPSVPLNMRKSQSSQTSITRTSSPLLSLDRNKKIIDVTNKITELLTEENAKRRGWNKRVKEEINEEDAGMHLGADGLLYNGAIMEGQQPLTSTDRHLLLPGVFTATGAPPPIMAAPQSMVERILNLNLEIIHLLEGEDYIACKLSSRLVSLRKSQTCAVMAPPVLMSLYKNIKKILVVTKKITELLTEESANPRRRNATVKKEIKKEQTGMEDCVYIEEHRGFYKGATMEEQPPLTADGRHGTRDVEEYPLASPDGEISQDDAASDLSEDRPSTTTLLPGHQRKKFPVPSAAGDSSPSPSASGEHSTDSSTAGDCSPRPSLPVTHHLTDGESEELPCSDDESSNDLVIHQLSLSEEEPDSCSESGEPVPSEGVLNNPIEEKTYVCSECNKCFSSEEDFLSHQNSHTRRRPRQSTRTRRSTQIPQAPLPEEEPFSCSVCDKRFAKRAHLSSHFKIHTGERPFVCAQCEKCFSWKGDLIRHERIHTGEKPFKCTECGESFTRRRHLISHFKNHSGENLFSCPECGKCFTLKESLIVHQRSHVGEKPYTCLECNKAFVCKKTLSRHYRTHSDFKPYCCSVCNRTFAVKAYLMSHLKTHTGEKPFSCPQCGKSFSWKGGLSRHFRTHFGDKPFSCSECGKCFKEKTHLTAHLRTHSGEKPFPCPECGICFTRRAHLISHLSTHNGDRPFSCSYCVKSFSTKKGRAKHERTHTAKIPYSCAECGECFTTRLEFASHSKTHANEGPFFCPQCGAVFSDQSSLISHLNSHRQQEAAMSESES